MLKIPQLPDISAMVPNDSFTLIYSRYTVTVNGQSCPVRLCRVSAMPFNRMWPGYQRSLDQTEEAGYITFSADEPVTLQVECNNVFSQSVLRPLSKGISLKQSGNTVEFILKEHGAYVLELDDEHHALHIFYNPIKIYTEKATYHFGPGIHFPGIITLKDDESVYIDEEAIVFGSIYTEGAQNIRIFGGGVLNGSTERRILEHCYEPFTKGTVRLYNSKNITIEDVILQDSATWILSLFNCDHAMIDGVKMVGHWRYNTDGIDVVNTSHVIIRNCFIRSFDDTVTLKGIYGHKKPIEDIMVEHCVLWCGWGRNCEVGVETDTPEYRNIVFRDCDLIRSNGVAIDIQNGSGADIHDVAFENLRVEFQVSTQPEILQKRDDQVYEPENPYTPRLIFAESKLLPGYEKFGMIRNITYRNIQVFMENGVLPPKLLFRSRDPQTILRNFQIQGITVNGEPVPIEFFDVTIENAEEILWKS